MSDVGSTIRRIEYLEVVKGFTDNPGLVQAAERQRYYCGQWAKILDNGELATCLVGAYVASLGAPNFHLRHDKNEISGVIGRIAEALGLGDTGVQFLRPMHKAFPELRGNLDVYWVVEIVE